METLTTMRYPLSVRTGRVVFELTSGVAGRARAEAIQQKSKRATARFFAEFAMHLPSSYASGPREAVRKVSSAELALRAR
jgi:hypothetical protein